jgi:hypothetical protein
MERIIMICSNCSTELGYVEVSEVSQGFYRKYICGVCMANLVPDSNSPIEDIPEEPPIDEEPINEEPINE